MEFYKYVCFMQNTGCLHNIKITAFTQLNFTADLLQLY